MTINIKRGILYLITMICYFYNTICLQCILPFFIKITIISYNLLIINYTNSSNIIPSIIRTIYNFTNYLIDSIINYSNGYITFFNKMLFLFCLKNESIYIINISILIISFCVFIYIKINKTLTHILKQFLKRSYKKICYK
jgi:hypothetical protein